MKNISRAILLAVLGAAFVPAAKASSGFDLILGFTQGGGNTSGNDYLLDIGPMTGFGYPGSTPLYNGEQWNLAADPLFAAQGFNLATVQWGAIGDALYGDGATTQMLWVTTMGNQPPGILTDSRLGVVDTGISSIEENVFGGGGSSQGQETTVVAGNQNSWSSQTISGSLQTQFVNSYGNPNIVGESQDVLWGVTEGNPVAAPVGEFTLADTGVLTFTSVPEPGTVALTAAGGLLLLAWRHRLGRRSKA